MKSVFATNLLDSLGLDQMMKSEETILQYLAKNPPESDPMAQHYVASLREFRTSQQAIFEVKDFQVGIA